VDLPGRYAEPYDPGRPTVGFDEVRKEPHGQARPPLPVQPGGAGREDHESTREGTANPAHSRTSVGLVGLGSDIGPIPGSHFPSSRSCRRPGLINGVARRSKR
jgi:hypothetical protein